MRPSSPPRHAFRHALVVLVGAALLAGCAGTHGEKADGDDDDKAAPAIAVQAAVVAERAIAQTVVAEGSVVALPGRGAAVHPTGAGRVMTLAVRVGDRVQAGQALATLQEDPTVHADAVKAALALDLARGEAGRQERLYAAGVTPRAQLEQARAALASAEADATARQIAERQAHANARPTAPIAGVVTAVGAVVGSVVDPATPLVTIANLQKVGVQAELPASSLGSVRPGMPGDVKLADGTRLAARVLEVDPAVDPQTQRGKVLAEVDNAGGRLKLSMFASLALVPGSHRGIALPAVAVVGRAGRQVVYVIDHGVASERPIELGPAPEEGLAEIRSGLKVGEHVATGGAYQLTDGVKVKVVTSLDKPATAAADAAATGAKDDTP